MFVHCSLIKYFFMEMYKHKTFFTHFKWFILLKILPYFIILIKNVTSLKQ